MICNESKCILTYVIDCRNCIYIYVCVCMYIIDILLHVYVMGLSCAGCKRLTTYPIIPSSNERLRAPMTGDPQTPSLACGEDATRRATASPRARGARGCRELAMHSKSCCTMLHHTWWIQVMWIVRMTGLQTRFHHPSSIGNSKPGSGATRAIALFLLPQMHPLSTLESQHGLPILSSSQCPLFTCKVQQLSAHESAR